MTMIDQLRAVHISRQIRLHGRGYVVMCTHKDCGVIFASKSQNEAFEVSRAHMEDHGMLWERQ